MSFLRNTAGLLLTSGVTIPVGFVTSVLLARYLSPDDRGQYAIVTSFAVLATMMMQIGWPAASIYRLRRARSDPAQVTGAALLLVVVGSVVVVPASLALKDVIARELLDGAASDAFRLALAQVPFLLLALVFSAVARGIDRFRYQNVAHVVQVVGAAGGCAVVLIAMSGGLTSVLWLLLAVHAATSIGLFAVVVGETGVSLRVPAAEVWDSLRFGSRAYVEVLATRLHERADIFLIAYFLHDPAQVAFYTIAAGLVRQVWILPEAIGQAAFPHMASQTEGEAADFACKVSRQSFFLVSMTAVALAFAAPTLLPLIYGADYAASVVPFLFLLPGMALLTVFRVLTRYFSAVDRQKANVVTQLVSVTANLALNALWIPRYGISGAAAASMCSYSLQAVLITVLFVRVSGKHVVDPFTPRREDFDSHRRRLAEIWARARSSA